MKLSFRGMLLGGCALVTIVGMLAMAGSILYIIQSTSRDTQTAKQPLDAAEKEVLDEVLKAAGIRYEELRQVGVLARLDMPENDRAIAIERGHVQLLILRKVPVQASAFAALRFSAWPELEVLALTDCGLNTFPDLSGCVVLRTVDLSRNNISAIPAASVPPQVTKLLDLSDNRELADLSPLAKLIKCEVIDAHRTKVTSFDSLIALPLTLLDLRDAQVQAMPAALPISRSFRVDVGGCPVSSPPGFLARWNFDLSQGTAAGGQRTSGGVVRRDTVDAVGAWDRVPPHICQVSLNTDPKARGYTLDPVELEVLVLSGRLRVYLLAPADPRGPWFEQGYVKETDVTFRTRGRIYVEATQGHPARLTGNLDFVNGHAYFLVEPQDGKEVSGMSYRVWRNK
ncbi:MAG: leucine-rich repeat domain-containing protein [Candidatus Methylacidiphilales bacterium]|nr:leucine-rich repeat domain-containing protein [Candidatus Methylacidiphilales bacterium]